jgi:hypothetical protein
MLSTSFALAGPCIESFKGDLSGDGEVGLEDAIMGLEILAGWEKNQEPEPASDVDGNEAVGLEEVAYALQVAAGFRPDTPSIQNRLALELQKAGSGLDAYPTTGEYDIAPFIFRNNLGPNGSDEITIRFVAEISNPCGENPDPASGVASACDLLPPLTLSEAVFTAASEFGVAEDLTDAPYSAWDEGCYCQGVVYDAPQWGLPVLVKTPAGYQPAAAETLFITGVQSLFSKFQFRSFFDENGDRVENRLQNSFPAGGSVSSFLPQPIESVRIFISSANVLMRQNLLEPEPTPLFENVHNIQFAFGIDPDQDGMVDDWIGDDPSDELDAGGDLFVEDKFLVDSICLVLIE